MSGNIQTCVCQVTDLILCKASTCLNKEKKCKEYNVDIPYLLFDLFPFVLVCHNQWGERCWENREHAFDCSTSYLLGKGIAAVWSSTHY